MHRKVILRRRAKWDAPSKIEWMGELKRACLLSSQKRTGSPWST
ncbi:hypothetical protein RUMHYD_00299 [Blautia hydrogenotrophica DSM 10507]|uniref:Uncharacterized protein n=1 Tax=Blautia hydrogenotrophica (strain DSM 10507 / JCM 14656 / S5a33) TaxID=476272 RepID=C0CHI5_BLAHS|nr:hypothetical protein RUMHYD_00299 [Blautia hydrogenotrophica DSM 10507]